MKPSSQKPVHNTPSLSVEQSHSRQGKNLEDSQIATLAKRVHTLSRQITVPVSIDQAFEFFSKAENLERLTPPSLRFQILTSLPIAMRKGVHIEYRLRLFGIPFGWLTEITDWEPQSLFVDVQRKGPYLLWEHEHTFEPTDQGTIIRDHLRYAVPGGFLEPIITRLFVKPQVERIFDYRSTQIVAILGSSESTAQFATRSQQSIP